MKRVCILCVAVLVAAGCSKRRPAEEQVFEKDNATRVVSILLDMSGSFESMMAEKGKAYAFCLHLVDRYFRDSIGSDDRLIISMISGSERALIWEGKPLDLRREFPSPKKFQKFLKAQLSNSGGSLVYTSLTRTIRYMLDDDRISGGKVKSAVFCLSDMMDTTGMTATSNQVAQEPNESVEAVAEALSEYAEAGGIIGLYYVDQELVHDWKDRLKDLGFKRDRFRVQSEIVGRPQLPTFD